MGETPGVGPLREIESAGAKAARPSGSTAVGRGVPDRDQAQQAGAEFEAVFLAQMLAPMFEGLDTDGYFGGGQAEALYRSLLIDEFGKVLSRAGGVGIADTVAQEILKLQEVE